MQENISNLSWLSESEHDNLQESEEEESDEGELINYYHEKCEKLCETFQLPPEYRKIVHLNSLYCDDLIEEYNNLSGDSGIYLTNKFVSELLISQIKVIDYEEDGDIKKILFLILFSFMNIKTIKEIILCSNKCSDTICNKIKRILVEEKENQEFVNYIKNNSTFNI